MRHATLYLLSLLFVLQWATPTLNAQCDPGHSEFVILLEADESAVVDNTRWEIRDTDNHVVHSGTEAATLCLAWGECYEFFIYDDFGNGLWNAEQSGFFSISYEGELVASAVDFGFELSATFGDGCVPGSTCFTPIEATIGNTYTVLDGEAWYRFVPDQQGFYEISACDLGNSCNTSIWVYDRCVGLTGDDSQEEAILYGNDECNGNQASINAIFLPGQTYYIRAGDQGDDCVGESFQFSLAFNGLVYGCTDALACNFDPLATEDNGSCIYNPSADCPPGPDLTVRPGVLESSLYATTVNGNDGCYVREGCLQGYGPRQVARFTTYIENIGTEDYVIGSPDPDNEQFEFDECHGHWHQEGYAEYRLYDTDGVALPVGFKNGFCVLDLSCTTGTRTYSCSYMGISAGCADIYSSSLACQWVDLTDLPEGQYTLVVVVNWENNPDLFGREEVSYENNWDQVCFELSRNANGDHDITVISACPTYEDCNGLSQGDAQPDCNGVCGGESLYGDVNSNLLYDYGDVSMYINGILDGTLPSNNCTELTGDDQIDLEDPVWLNDCILVENNTDGHTSHAHSCQLPTIGIDNPNQSVSLSLVGHNEEEQYVTVALQNPGAEIVATHLSLSGAVVSNVELVTPDDNLDAEVFYRPDGQIIVFSYGFDSPTRFNNFEPFLRVSYSSMGEEGICLDEVHTTINSRLERIENLLGTVTCTSQIIPCGGDVAIDSDGDGVCDSDDLCQGSDDSVDSDEDGIPDGCDNCIGVDDSDGDGVCDDEDICQGADDALFCDSLVLTILLDNYAVETSILITNFAGDIVWQVGGFGGADNGELKEYGFCLPGNDYDFTIFDSFGDGICCGYGEGYYELKRVEDDAILASGGEFDSEETTSFTITTTAEDADEDGVCDLADQCPGQDDSLDEDEDSVPDGCDVCPGGDDTVDLNMNGVPDACEGGCAPEGSTTIVLTPEPVGGVYDSGQEVEVCVTVNIWEGNAAGTIEWLHALTFNFGDGWDANSINPAPPVSCSGDGVWDWYNSWVGCNTGLTFGPGFAYDSDNGVACGGAANDGDPGNNWGDGFGGCSSIPAPGSPVTFCFDITVANCGSDIGTSDLGIEVSLWSDGDSGSWTQTGCNSGQVFQVDATGNCCEDSDEDGICDEEDICPGGNDLADADEDGIPDDCDECPNSATGDTDGDGVCDDEDVCPCCDDLADADDDGIPDGCDICPNSATDDSDGDGVCDDEDVCLGSDDNVDADEDGIPDGCDDCPNSSTGDSDGDGVCDDLDICPGSDDAADADEDGVPDGCDECPNSATGDSDGDGVCDDLDACPGSDDTADADEDGVPDGCDDCPNSATGDSDGDGVCDDLDACPGSNDAVDADEDGIPDGCDDCPNSATGDSDGDGICDDLDICPGSDDTADTDEDGVPDGCDDCPNSATGDSDGDGVCDDLDICPGSDDNIDSDGDGVPNGCDTCPGSSSDDSDGDGVCDDADICPGSDDTVDADADGIPDGCDDCPNSATGDSDGDGVCDDLDACPGSDDTADADADGIPDGCDDCPNSSTGDSDGDGICDDLDICPGSDDAADADADGVPDGCDDCPNSATGDSDGDGVCDDLDICPGSDDTADADEDGVPDGCDDCPNSATGDSDGDGVCDDLDVCPGNDDTADADEDGIPDGCDLCPNSPTGDSDDDGVCDDEDICPGSNDLADADGDGVPDGCDECPNSANGDSDGDGVCDDVDICPGEDDLADLDGDGVPDGCDDCPNSATGDSDEDGICDDADSCPGSDDLVDTDSDGVPDGCDLCPGFDDDEDMDEDGIPDGCDDTIDDQDDEEVADLFEINQLYPNPTTGMLNLVLSSEATGTVLIYDVYGRVLAQYDLSQTKRLELYTNSLVAGTYMLVVRSGQEELASRRFVKLAY
ncbi:MAG: lysyl oxidase family protein [Bacteroidota bacterium]